MMDINILKSLDEEELIIIESRLKKSIFDLNKLVSELYNENFRISQNNFELSNLKNKSQNTKEMIGSLLKRTFFPKSNNSEKPKSALLCSSKKTVDYKFPCEAHLDLFDNCEEKKNYKERKSNTNGHLTQPIEATHDEYHSSQEFPSSIHRQIPDSQQSSKKLELTSENENQTTNTECGDMPKYTISLQMGESNFVKIKFSKFENDQNREEFAKEIIKNIGLKPIYFDCIKNLLKDSETRNDCTDKIIDIANLDPWENNCNKTSIGI